MIYSSQLLETPRLIELLNQYPIGLEVISFSIGSVLDDLQASIDYYQKELGPFKDKIPMIFHGPFLDLAPGSCDAKVIELTKERFENAYEAGKAFQVNQFVFHTGYMPRTYPVKYWLENVIAFWKDFTKDKLEDNYFYIENVLDEDWHIVKAIVDAINHPHFLVCLDIGHIHAYTETKVNDWIKGLGNRIGHVHLHNNEGTQDTHSSLLKGTLQIESILKALKEAAPKASWTLEIGDEKELISSLDWLQDQGFV